MLRDLRGTLLFAHFVIEGMTKKVSKEDTALERPQPISPSLLTRFNRFQKEGCILCLQVYFNS
jgi:hypothetical protein